MMLVRLCDGCELVLGIARPCVAVALRQKGTVALRMIPDGATVPAGMSAHFCSPTCATNWVQQWLTGMLPEPAAEVEPERPPKPTRMSTWQGVAPTESITETAEWPPAAASAAARRQPTPQEIADQQAVLGAVLGREN